MSEWGPISWGLPDGEGASGCSIDLVRRPEGPPRYAVRLGGLCLSHAGRWDYEPLPSSRTDEWLAAHRFDTFEAARAAANKAIEG